RRHHEAQGPGPRVHLRPVDAPTVVFDLQEDARPLADDAKHELPARRLARGEALLARLDPVVDGVPQDVDEDVDQLLEDLAVQLDVATLEAEVDLLPERSRRVADHPRQPVEDGARRLHPHPEHDPLELAHPAADLLDDRSQRRRRRICRLLELPRQDREVAHAVGQVDEMLPGDANLRGASAKLGGRASRAPVTWPAVPWAGRPGRLRLPRDVYIRLLDGAALARRRAGSDDLVDRPDLDESDLPARTDRVRQTPVVRRVRDEEPELAAEVFADRLRPRPED